MRHGFTTGSCAAAAAKAAAYMLLSGKRKEKIVIETPKGIPFPADIVNISMTEQEVTCAVIKDGGDDPDVTTGASVYATVCFWETSDSPVIIDGGAGVGRVTKPGLDQPVGNAAINSVPRQMITKEVTEVMQLLDFGGTLKVVISVTDGESIAQNTFNPRLGIVGGISILGTSGVVEPMSAQALLDTIRVELSQQKALGRKTVSIAPGNYGLDFMKRAYDFDLDSSVKCSNFIGQTMDMLVEMDFEEILLAGHIGKLIKVAGGIMNTHSREADSRMEIMAAQAAYHGVPTEKIRQIMDAVSTEEGIRILNTTGKTESVMQCLLDKILFYLNKRMREAASGKPVPRIEVILFSNEFGLLAKSKGAEELISKLKVIQKG